MLLLGAFFIEGRLEGIVRIAQKGDGNGVFERRKLIGTIELYFLGGRNIFLN